MFRFVLFDMLFFLLVAWCSFVRAEKFYKTLNFDLEEILKMRITMRESSSIVTPWQKQANVVEPVLTTSLPSSDIIDQASTETADSPFPVPVQRVTVPSSIPTNRPTAPSFAPTRLPTAPSFTPTKNPTPLPAKNPTPLPAKSTVSPSVAPTIVQNIANENRLQRHQECLNCVQKSGNNLKFQYVFNNLQPIECVSNVLSSGGFEPWPVPCSRGLCGGPQQLNANTHQKFNAIDIVNTESPLIGFLNNNRQIIAKTYGEAICTILTQVIAEGGVVNFNFCPYSSNIISFAVTDTYWVPYETKYSEIIFLLDNFVFGKLNYGSGLLPISCQDDGGIFPLPDAAKMCDWMTTPVLGTQISSIYPYLCDVPDKTTIFTNLMPDLLQVPSFVEWWNSQGMQGRAPQFSISCKNPDLGCLRNSEQCEALNRPLLPNGDINVLESGCNEAFSSDIDPNLLQHYEACKTCVARSKTNLKYQYLFNNAERKIFENLEEYEKEDLCESNVLTGLGGYDNSWLIDCSGGQCNLEENTESYCLRNSEQCEALIRPLKSNGDLNVLEPSCNQEPEQERINFGQCNNIGSANQCEPVDGTGDCFWDDIYLFCYPKCEKLSNEETCLRVSYFTLGGSNENEPHEFCYWENEQCFRKENANIACFAKSQSEAFCKADDTCHWFGHLFTGDTEYQRCISKWYTYDFRLGSSWNYYPELRFVKSGDPSPDSLTLPPSSTPPPPPPTTPDDDELDIAPESPPSGFTQLQDTYSYTVGTVTTTYNVAEISTQEAYDYASSIQAGYVYPNRQQCEALITEGDRIGPGDIFNTISNSLYPLCYKFLYNGGYWVYFNEAPEPSNFYQDDPGLMIKIIDQVELSQTDTSVGTTSPCDPNPCKNGGMCMEADGYEVPYICNCPFSTSGDNCEMCQSGLYAKIGGDCTACIIGKYNDEQGAIDCKDCPSGKYTDLPGQSACIPESPPSGFTQLQNTYSYTIGGVQTTYNVAEISTREAYDYASSIQAGYVYPNRQQCEALTTEGDHIGPGDLADTISNSLYPLCFKFLYQDVQYWVYFNEAYVHENFHPEYPGLMIKIIDQVEPPPPPPPTLPPPSPPPAAASDDCQILPTFSTFVCQDFEPYTQERCSNSYLPGTSFNIDQFCSGCGKCTPPPPTPPPTLPSCQPGSYVFASECRDCPVNTYTNQISLTMCTDCPSGKYTDLSGQSACIDSPLCQERQAFGGSGERTFDCPYYSVFSRDTRCQSDEHTKSIVVDGGRTKFYPYQACSECGICRDPPGTTIETPPPPPPPATPPPLVLSPDEGLDGFVVLYNTFTHPAYDSNAFTYNIARIDSEEGYNNAIIAGYSNPTRVQCSRASGASAFRWAGAETRPINMPVCGQFLTESQDSYGFDLPVGAFFYNNQQPQDIVYGGSAFRSIMIKLLTDTGFVVLPETFIFQGNTFNIARIDSYQGYINAQTEGYLTPDQQKCEKASETFGWIGAEDRPRDMPVCGQAQLKNDQRPSPAGAFFYNTDNQPITYDTRDGPITQERWKETSYGGSAFRSIMIKQI